MTVEQSFDKLNTIVEKLNDKNITLDESMELFKEGLKISSSCVEELKAYKGEINKIKIETDRFFEEAFIEEN